MALALLPRARPLAPLPNPPPLRSPWFPHLRAPQLAALMPALGGRLRAFALAKTEWDVDAALNMLRSFQVAQLDKVNAIIKARDWGGGLPSAGAC